MLKRHRLRPPGPRPAVRARLLVLAVVGLLAPVATLTAGQPAAAGADKALASSTATSPVAPVRLTPAEVGWVTGTVVDHAGKPVVGALVNTLGPKEVPEKALLEDVTDRRTTTDQNGHFRVRQHPDGYLVQACEIAPDHPHSCQETALGVNYTITYAGPDGVTDSWLRQTRLFPAAATDRNVGTMVVAAPAQIAGRISGAEFASIAVMRLNDTVAFRTDTDGKGNYIVKGLAQGRYYVSANVGGNLPWRSPNVDAKSGQTMRVNGTLTRGAAINGQLVDGDRPAAGIDVIVARGDEWLAAGTTDRKGKFAFSGFEPGTYKVGILYAGGPYRPTAERVTLRAANDTASVRVRAKKGATLTFTAFENGRRARSNVDELRDRRGVPILKQRNMNGTITYTGLAPGRYTAVVSGKKHFASRTVRVKGARTYDLGNVQMTHKHLTISGRTAPGAVVEATTGDLCPPGSEGQRTGAFDHFVKAGVDGRYEMRGLVPGRYMLGSDGWPANYVPSCRSDVEINTSKTFDLPLSVGSSVAGRLVYATSGLPVITPLSYELHYTQDSSNNPTDEHPARGKTDGSSGLFSIDALRSGSAEGELATETGDNVTDERYFVIFPYQDGTPYWYETATSTLNVGEALQLGDIKLNLRGTEATS